MASPFKTFQFLVDTYTSYDKVCVYRPFVLTMIEFNKGREAKMRI